MCYVMRYLILQQNMKIKLELVLSIKFLIKLETFTLAELLIDY